MIPRIQKIWPYDRDRKPGGVNHLRCRYCGNPCAGRRTSFCSPACVHEWRLRAHPSYLRSCVRRRDRGVCAVCRRDTYALRNRLYALLRTNPDGVFSFLNRHRLSYKKEMRWNQEEVRVTIHSLWQADHVIPIVEGGGGCGLENLQSLCVWCHRKATRALRARMKARSLAS